MFQDEGLVSSEQRIREWKYYEGVQLSALNKRIIVFACKLDWNLYLSPKWNMKVTKQTIPTKTKKHSLYMLL